MNEFLSSGRGITHNKYNRLMIIACLDTLFNLPVLIVILVTNILVGKDSFLNYPYISWKNVHDGAGGLFPGSSLSSILQEPAGEWSTDKWEVVLVKWNEWSPSSPRSYSSASSAQLPKCDSTTAPRFGSYRSVWDTKRGASPKSRRYRTSRSTRTLREMALLRTGEYVVICRSGR